MPNPYAPPGSEVADPSRTMPPVPPAVRRACLLFLSSLALGLVTLLPGVRPVRPDDAAVPALFTLLVVLFFGGITVWLTWKLYRGRNWARWTMLAYVLFGWWIGASELTDDFLASPLAGLIDLVCIAIEAIGCWALFFGAGAGWYRTLAAARSRR